MFFISNPCTDPWCEACYPRNYTTYITTCLNNKGRVYGTVTQTTAPPKGKPVVVSTKNDTTKNLLKASSKNRKKSRWC